MYKYGVVTAISLAGLASTASAVTVFGFGPGGLIPPSGTGGSGTAADVFTSTIVISDNVSISDVSVDLYALTHTWLGDLSATLTHNNSGASVDLFNRVGRTGGAGVGDSTDFDGFYTFQDGAAGDLWTVASSLDSMSVIPGGSYFPTGVDGAMTSLVSAFAGESSMGVWTLTITDHQGADFGSLGLGGQGLRGFGKGGDGWGLTLVGQVIPTPTAAGLGVAGLFGMGARRRRRNA